MRRILLVECMQEISSFNPLRSDYSDFTIQRGDELLRQRGLNTAIGGMLAVLEPRDDVVVVPVYGAQAPSAGPLAAADWQRLSGELLSAVEARAAEADGILVSLHGAMGADGELDPEGYLLREIRRMSGPHTKIVISLDLHGIATRRMLEAVDALTVYHTYPHSDFADTGERAARLMLKVLASDVQPVTARVVIPALVRGDELITATGCYGDLIADCKRLEREGLALQASIMIGNPFTDVPELCTQVLVTTDRDGEAAEREAVRLAQAFWSLRGRMHADLVSPREAIAQAAGIAGPVVFKDAADATSSGAAGDSNAILLALRSAGYPKRVLAQIVDPRAAAAAHAAGVGAAIEVELGGYHDPGRFKAMRVSAKVTSLSDGQARLETMGSPIHAGPTAVLVYDNVTVVVMSRTVMLFDRAMYYANGLDPKDSDLIVVKSPHTEHHMYDAWVTCSFNIDCPGASSANLKSLGHTVCARPMFPLDEDATFDARAQIYRR
jgi:microcystin degradation protein MlrC